VTSPRDEIDDWLGGEVRPLNPPPGSLDRIRRRARKRKTRQAVFTAAACAVVLAAAVAVPQLLAGQRPGGPNPALAGGSTPPTQQPSTGHSQAGRVTPDTRSSAPVQGPQHTRLSTTTSGTIPPGHFRPTSVTFVGTNNGTGGVVGAVIGQAGPPCATQYCTSLAGTSDYGSSWYGVSAPYATGPGGSTGVSQLRFANLRDGWAFGPGLFETSGGGWPWHKESTSGQRVIDVEADAQGHALAIFGSCTGTGADYAANCTGFTLQTSVAGSRIWTQVTVPTGSMSTGQAASAALVVAGTTGYVLSPTSDVLSGPVSGGTWQVAGKAPCAPGQAQVSGLPSQAQLAASPTQLLLACAGGTAGGSSLTRLYTSADGSAWRLAGTVTHAGAATSLASGAPGQIVLATASGIHQSGDDGKTWHEAALGGGPPDSGFSYIGMTNGSDGVAVPADASLGLLYVTTDAGLHWQQRPIAG
jgi:hypothetical protein